MRFSMENNIYVLDSNVFVWAFYEDDSLHELSLNILQKIKDSKIIVPYCVVQEVCSIFAHRFWKQKADDFLKFLLETENRNIMQNSSLLISNYWSYMEKINSLPAIYFFCLNSHSSRVSLGVVHSRIGILWDILWQYPGRRLGGSARSALGRWSTDSSNVRVRRDRGWCRSVGRAR